MDFNRLIQDFDFAPLIRSVVVVVGAVLMYRLVVRAGRRSVEKIAAKGVDTAERAETLWLMVRRIVFLVVLLATILVLLQIWGISIAPFLALGAVLGAAIGFGAQDAVKDLLAGFFILAEDQFRIGDVVNIADTAGVVEDIQFRVTKLRDLEGNVHYVPNGQIRVATNLTSIYAYALIDIGVDYSVDVDKGLEVMRDELEALASDPDWRPLIRGEVEILGLDRLEDSAMVLRGRLQTLAAERWGVRREALRRLKKRFDAEGITIPFPQLTIHKSE